MAMLEKIFNKILWFLFAVITNGFLAIFISALAYFVLVFAGFLALIPVYVVAGNEAVEYIETFLNGDTMFKIIYVLVFLCMMADDLGLPNLKTAIKNWRSSAKKEAK